MKGTGQHPTAVAVSSTCSAAPVEAASEEDGTFGFPYDPYPSQLRFMAAVWRALQGSSQKTRFAALEMPTGGGKTLSFLCPSVLWLKQQEEQLLLHQLQQQQQHTQAQQRERQDSLPTRKMATWVKAALLQQQRQQVQQFLRERSKRLKEAAVRADTAAAAAAAASPVQQLEQQKCRDLPLGSKRHAAATSLHEHQELREYDAFAPEEPAQSIDSEGTSSSHDAWGISSQQGFSDALRKPQIVICSRTHQQLQQYIGEIRRMHKQGKRQEIKDFVAIVAAGRQQLCLHPDVCDGVSSNSSSSNGSSDLGDKCSYLVSKGLCSYYKKKHLVSDAAVAAALDIEDLRRIGKSVGGCPYYGCRAAVAEADVVLLPFSLAFPANGNMEERGVVSLAGSVFCVDEAHHLSAALSSSKSAALSHQTAASAARLLSLYAKSFTNRLAPRSLHLLQQLSRFVETIYKRLQPFCCCGQQQQPSRQQWQQHHVVDDLHASPPVTSTRREEAGTADAPTAARGAAAAEIRAHDGETVLTATELLRLFKLESFDLHELIAFLSDPTRRICQKLRGFAMYHNHKLQQPQEKQQQTKLPHLQKQNKQQLHSQRQLLEPSCLYTIRNFLCSLLGMDAADRLIITSVHKLPTGATSTMMGPPGAADGTVSDGADTKLASGNACCCCRLEVVCLATVKASRLVVLMGGTLSPFESLSRFVRCLPPSSSLFLSADSDAARDRVLALPISRLSSSCSDFCFEFSQRMQFPMQFVSLLRLLLCVSDSVSGGVVVFFPSFATLQLFLAVAGVSDGIVDGDAAAAAAPLVEKLRERGPLFAERRTPGPTKTDAGIRIAYGAALWQLYNSAVLRGDSAGVVRDAESIKCTRNLKSVCGDRSSPLWQDERCKATCVRARTQTSNTVFLFCVMGGRLSEGVNFSNALARLLVVVGMPFPSIKDKVFLLHKQHYNEIMTAQQATGDEAEDAGWVSCCGRADAKQLNQQQKEKQCIDYGLLQCMITVNQTIGRAIRHSKDYAAILLVDKRYSLARVQQLLPRWLLQNLDTSSAEDEKQRVHLSVPTVSREEEDIGEAINRRLQCFFGPLERTELEAPK
ncbi:helicase, putative [Eimeria mitis]|uniref:Helicase, putative n=1 Tax=Eimeria mitis TaxID=44415 RepID=U6JNC5_9EIME|nr:helicase, putative [Eimeria mitis]CDJ27045.1 helicase, putative [Eimeria mitis]